MQDGRCPQVCPGLHWDRPPLPMDRLMVRIIFSIFFSQYFFKGSHHLLAAFCLYRLASFGHFYTWKTHSVAFGVRPFHLGQCVQVRLCYGVDQHLTPFYG